VSAASPRRRGKSAKSLELINASIEILGEIEPATIRAVCYRLFVAGLIPDMSKASTNRVSRQLVDARESGALPWEWIVDETREAERIPLWDDPEQIIDAAVRNYRRDYWKDQPYVVEVWSEKGTVRGTLAPILDRYGVTFRVMHGYGSATTLKSIAAQTAEVANPFIALYVGDWDPSGLHMSQVDIPRRIERYDGCASVRRIALTRDDIGADLPSFEATSKARDPRYQWYVRTYGGRCWELDAMSPVVLRDRVESEILDLIDRDAWNHAVRIEKTEIESMRGFAEAWRESISRHAPKYPGPEGGTRP